MRLNRNTLFLTELVLNVLIFALCAACCVLMLVRANALSARSAALTDAVYIAQSVAETFRGQTGSWDFDASGSLTQGQAAYTARCSREGDALTVEVFDARGESVYTLQGWGEDLP